MSRLAPLWPALVLAASVLLPSATNAQAVVTNPYHVVVPSVPSPYWGYTYNPYGLHGAADVLRAQGEYQVNKQRTAQIQEEVQAKKLENRRKELEFWDWERDYRAGATERERKRLQAVDLERSRNDPPLGEIVSGKALNDMLDDMKKLHAPELVGSVAVEAEWLPHIHVRSPSGTNIGLLKEDKLRWPILLRTPEFASQRELLDQLLGQAKAHLNTGQVALEDEVEMRRCVASLQNQLKATCSTSRQSAREQDYVWTPGNYITAKRFLKDVEDAVNALDSPDAAVYLRPLQGKTVAEIVRQMKKDGLSFASATTGGERHYVALHRAFADESARLRAVLGTNYPGR